MIQTDRIIPSIFFLMLCTVFANAQKVVDEKGNEKLLGLITKDELMKDSFADWYNLQYDVYNVDAETLSSFQEELKNYEVTIFLGTWCGDSKREVPRFYKILEAANFPKSQITTVAVDNSEDNYKKSPTGEEKGLNIHRVPTFIFFKDGKEVNRIVEYPVVSLEEDIATIVLSKVYTPNYGSVEKLIRVLKQKGMGYIKNSKEAIEEFGLQVKNEHDLNGYGYVLLYAKEYEKAIAVFALNTKLFPNKMNPYDSLAEAYELSGDKARALKNYEQALATLEKNPIVVRLRKKIESLSTLTHN